ncbi:thymidylate synthase [Pelagibacteraceae bacterium]|nr:thymidylate synthase [Pelagibacteraceae bacterium]
MLKNVVEINKHKNRDLSQPKHEEYQYLNLIQDLLNEGKLEEGRNGKTLRGVGAAMHFSLENGKIPILTTKKTAWKTGTRELLWFIKGQTDNKILTDQGVGIWKGNTTAEFLEKCGLDYEPGRSIGPMYGHQARFFNAAYTGCETDYTGQGIDQLQKVIDDLKNPETRNSRRHVVSVWNPEQLDQGVLNPCHILYQFVVTDGNKLSCLLQQRSVDTILGCPINILSYSILTCIIAKICDLEPYEFIHYCGDVHLYDDLIEIAKEQITREPYPFPTLEILNKRDNINDYVIEDFKLHDYQHHPQLKGAMRA